MTTHRILLVDDDARLGQLLQDYFKQFDLALTAVTSPSAGFEQLNSDRPDLMVLDVMLPEMDGFEMCKRLRAQSDVYGHIPVVMLTARGEVTDRIVGLELGADDYLAKPFEPRELVARIQNVLRRSQAMPTGAAAIESPPRRLWVDGMRIDLEKQAVELDGQLLDLTSMEYALLALFVGEPGKTFHRDELMNRLRGIDADLYSRAVDTLVSRLRHKLLDTSKPPRFIKTVWGRGYTFVGNVEAQGESAC